MSALVSSTHLRNTIDQAGEAFRGCWQVVTKLRSPSGGEETALALVNFQTQLLKPIVLLETLHREIQQERKRRIARKASYDSARFARRMEQLDGYAKAVREALAIGRALGDAFAWFFYERDRDLIAQHFKHQRQPFLPPGDGGLGERLTLERLQGLGQKLLLMHGLTTFLRMGDVSFVDLGSARVVSVGELKTQRVGEQELRVTLALIAGDRKHLPKFPEAKVDAAPAARLAPELKARLERQMKQMKAAYDTVRTSTPDYSSGSQGEFYFDALSEAIAKSHTKHFEFVQAGPSLVIGAVCLNRSRALSARLMGEGKVVDHLILGAERWARSIFDVGLEQNSLVIDAIGVGDGLVLAEEAIPFLWWPCSDEVLQKILFGQVMVVTFYNPAHLWGNLKERGFELTWDARGKLKKASRLVNGKTQELYHFDFFHRLIQRSLLTPKTVMRMIDETLNVSALKAQQGPVRVNIRPLVAGSPPRTGRLAKRDDGVRKPTA